MSIFKLSTGKQAETNGSFEMGGSSDPIPEGTKLKAAITEVKWAEYQGERYINARWDVLDGEYKKRVIFQKIKVFEADEKKADKARTMLAAIDANCGGKLQALEGEPTDMDLMKYLTNKPMLIRVGVWDLNGNKGNWVQMVSSASGAPASTPAAAKPKSAPKKEEAPADDSNSDGDIPF